MNARPARTTLLLLAAGLAGCASQIYSPEERAAFGDAQRALIAAQAIDPTAGLAPRPPTPADAKKMQAGIERYRKDDGKVDDDTLIKDVAGGEE